MHTVNKESAPTCTLLWVPASWTAFENGSLTAPCMYSLVSTSSFVKQKWRLNINLNIIRVLQLRATNTSSGSRKQILERHWIQRRVGGPRSERRRTEQLPGSMQQDERRSSGRVAQTPALATFRLSVLFCFTLYRVPTSVRQCLINQVWDTHWPDG